MPTLSFTLDPKYLAPGVPRWTVTATTPMIVADWNGDGILDVGITGLDYPNGQIGSNLVVWLGQPGGGYVVGTSSVLSAPLTTYFVRMTATADFNGDGRTDIYLGTVGDEIKATGEADVVLLSTVGGTFVRATGAPIDRPNYSHGSAVGDIDRDGDIDIFQSGGYAPEGQQTGQNVGSHLLLNDGKGNFTDATARLPEALQASGGRAVFASAIADINGDGYADLVIGHKGGLAPVLHTSATGNFYTYEPTGYQGGYYLNDGKGGFQAFQTLPGGVLPVWNSDTVDIRVFDANGDGRPDVVFSNYNSGLTQDASGKVIYATSTGPNDVNNQASSRDLQLFLNTGSGFADASAQISGAGNGMGVAAPIFQMYPVDLDGDGDLDLIGSLGSGPLSNTKLGNIAWLNDGAGRFTAYDLRAALAPAGLSSIYTITPFDANGDGLVDIGYETYARIPGSTAQGPSFGVLINNGDTPLSLRGSAVGGETLQGGTGGDTIVATAGANYLRGGVGNDVITGGSGFDDINGNMGADTLHGGLGDDWVVGGKENDSLFGDAGGDLVYGNLGNDTCDGGDGADIVRGGQGDDVISGGAGDDFVSGDRGSDTISGGAGADLFHGSQDAGIDRILDFRASEGDRVLLDRGTTYTLSQVGADTVVDMSGGNQMILVGTQLSSLPAGWIFTS